MSITAARGSTAPSGSASPFALRLTRPSWRDRRLILGLVLLLGSTLAGARLVGGSDPGSPVWVARHELAPGVALVPSDLEPRRVQVASSGPRYVSAAVPLREGVVLVRAVGEGELLPLAAVAAAATAGAERRVVTVPVEAFHAAEDLGRGDRVDVYVTPGGRDQQRPVATRLVAAADVVAVEDTSGRFGGASASRGVAISVEAADVPRLVAGLAAGTVDLVRVPRAVS